MEIHSATFFRQFYLKCENKVLSTKQATTPIMDAAGSTFDSDEEGLVEVGHNDELGTEVTMVNGWRTSHSNPKALKIEARRAHLKYLRTRLPMIDLETTLHRGATYSANLRVDRLKRKYARACQFLKKKRAAGVMGG